MIVATGVGIGTNAVSGLSEALLSAPPSIDPTAMGLAAAAAVAGVLSKELLYRETLRIGLEMRSPALIANAWHHRTDAWSSLVALGGLGGSWCGVPVLDSIGGVVVAAMVTRVGLQMAIENFDQVRRRGSGAGAAACVGAGEAACVGAGVWARMRDTCHAHAHVCAGVRPCKPILYAAPLAHTVPRPSQLSTCCPLSQLPPTLLLATHSPTSRPLSHLPPTQLTDAAVDDELLGQIQRRLVADDADALGTTALRCRRLGPYLHVESRLTVPFGLSVSAAQQVAATP